MSDSRIADLRAIVAAPPGPTDANARKVMLGNRRRDSSAELRLRSAMHRAGLRYRVDFPIRVEGRRPIRPDVAFTRARVAVFVDGCFWHGCPEHGRRPSSNVAYWGAKIELNRERDVTQTAVLRAGGWHVIRAWEHEDPEMVAQLVAAAVYAATATRVPDSTAFKASATA